MADLDLIPPHLHEKVAGIDAPEYEGKLSAVVGSGERIELAMMGRIATTWKPREFDTARSTGALLVVTDKRLLAIKPRGKGLFGKKDPQPLIASFNQSDDGNVFDAGVFNEDARKVIVSVCGAGPEGTPGSMDFWILTTDDPDLASFWAVNIKDNAIAGGGVNRRPRGV